jgi:hypothetical protein
MLNLDGTTLAYAELGAAAKRFANVLSIWMSSPIKKSP